MAWTIGSQGMDDHEALMGSGYMETHLGLPARV